VPERGLEPERDRDVDGGQYADPDGESEQPGREDALARPAATGNAAR
jgi:hypothetical protein